MSTNSITAATLKALLASIKSSQASQQETQVLEWVDKIKAGCVSAALNGQDWYGQSQIKHDSGSAVVSRIRELLVRDGFVVKVQNDLWPQTTYLTASWRTS